MVPPGTLTFSNRATTKTITATKTTKTTRKTMVPPGLTAVMVDSELFLTLTFSNKATTKTTTTTTTATTNDNNNNNNNNNKNHLALLQSWLTLSWSSHSHSPIGQQQ